MTLDYCATRSLVGAELADELFGLKIPPRIDMDFAPDRDMVAGIVADAERQFAQCAGCKDRRWCWPE